MPRKSSRPSASSSASSRRGGADPTSGARRINQVLASAGYGSRRQCEALIHEGRVDVDGVTVTDLSLNADPNVQKVRVDGTNLKPQKLVYYAVNKPVGIVTTNSDPRGRPRVVDLVPPTERVFPVGRLDLSSEGLILLTNDGDLAQRLAHPKYGVQKIYRVIVAGEVRGETMKKMREGMYIAEGFVQVDGAKIIKARAKATEMEIKLKEGKNREIRRILARLGHKVQQLRRVAIGSLKLGDVPAGAYRRLSREEVDKLRTGAENAERAAKVAASVERPASKQSIKRRPGGASRNVASRGVGTSTGKRTNKTNAKTPTGGPKTIQPRSVRKQAAEAASNKRKPETLPSRASTTKGTVIGGDAPKASRQKTERGSNPDIIRKRTAGKKPGGARPGAGKAGRKPGGKRGGGKGGGRTR